jgi:hypothetical protein
MCSQQKEVSIMHHPDDIQEKRKLNRNVICHDSGAAGGSMELGGQQRCQCRCEVIIAMAMVTLGIEAVELVALGSEGQEPNPRAHAHRLWRGEGHIGGAGQAVAHGVSTHRQEEKPERAHKRKPQTHQELCTNARWACREREGGTRREWGIVGDHGGSLKWARSSQNMMHKEKHDHSQSQERPGRPSRQAGHKKKPRHVKKHKTRALELWGDH